MNLKLMSFVLACGWLSACAPINTHFSCNETAGDKCLSIEEVNAMTEPRDEKRIASTRTIWLSPWKDQAGIVHENDTLFATIESTKGTV